MPQNTEIQVETQGEIYFEHSGFRVDFVCEQRILTLILRRIIDFDI